MRYQIISNAGKTLSLLAATALLAICVTTPLAYAGDTVNIMPAKSNVAEKSIDDASHTHPPIRLTPDKSEIINLPEKAASVIVGNPNHLSILADSASRLVLVPRATGASYFTILGQDGNVIMQRHVIVGSPKKQYMRIRRSCSGSTGGDCEETSIFYCPDMCHRIISPDAGSAEASGTADGNAEQSSGSAQAGNEEEDNGPVEEGTN